MSPGEGAKAEETVERKLGVFLSEAGMLRRARAIVELMDRLDRIRENAKELAAECKAEAKIVEKQMRLAAKELRDGEQIVAVQCAWREDETKLEMYLVRLDTEEEIERRPMSDQERQRTLPAVAEPRDEPLPGGRKAARAAVGLASFVPAGEPEDGGGAEAAPPAKHRGRPRKTRLRPGELVQ